MEVIRYSITVLGTIPVTEDTDVTDEQAVMELIADDYFRNGGGDITTANDVEYEVEVI